MRDVHDGQAPTEKPSRHDRPRTAGARYNTGIPISNAGQSRNARSGRRPLVVGQLPGPNHEVCVEQFVFLGLNDIDDYESSPCQRVADKRNFSAIGFDDLVEVTQTRSWLGIQWNACEITTAVNSPRVEDRSSRSSEPPTTNERWSAPAASARICGWTSTVVRIVGEFAARHMDGRTRQCARA